MLIRRLTVLAIAVLAGLAAPGAGLCVVPHYINYQGVLTDASGITINGTHDLTFKIYTSSSPGGAPLWTETHAGAQINDGLFNIILGAVTPLPDSLFASGIARWMGVTVDSDGEMTPRMRITSVPWAFKAAIADSALNVLPTSAGWAVSSNNVYSTVSGNVGVGTNSPLTKLHIRGYNINLPPAAFLNELLTVEAGDAVMGLYSDNGATYGSAIALGEIVSGALSNKWSIYRTTGASSRLTFSFGTDPSYAANAPILTMRSTGIGIGTTAPARKMEINDLQAYLRLTSSSAQGSVLELKSTSSDPGTWRGRINFLNASDAIEGSISYYPLGFMDQPGMSFNVGGSTRLFIHNSSGNLGLGTTSPARRIEISDPVAYLRLTSSDAQGSVLELKSTPSTAGTWRGRINFINASNAVEGSIEYYPLGFMDQPGMLFNAGGGTRLFINSSNGNVGVGTTAPSEKFEVAGVVKATILKLTGGSDIAEPFDVKAPSEIMKGMVLAIDPASPGKLKIADKAYDHCVAGIVSGAGDVEPALLMSQTGTIANGKYPVALTGRVYCWADASNGAIAPGDLLTTSDTPGYAMKVTDHALAQGAVLGKAMTVLREGTGLVLVLVSLQ